MEPEIENNLIKTIAIPGLDIAPELLELGIDELADNEAVTKLPVVGSFVAFGKGVLAVRDWLFVRNILAFLRGLNNVSEDKRQDWLLKLEDASFKKRVGEDLLGILNKMNSSRKSEVTGRIFAAYLREEIDYDTFVRLSEKLERLYLSDLELLKTDGPRNDDEKERYRSIGLYMIHYPGVKRPEALMFSSNQELIPNDDGITLVSIIRQE